MPVSFSWAENGYLPQFYTQNASTDCLVLTATITKPYRAEKVVVFTIIPTSVVPSSPWEGMCYYNTLDKVLYLYRNSQWENHNSDLLGTRDEGFVYIEGTNYYTYNSSTQMMESHSLASFQPWNHLYFKVESLDGTVPSSPSLYSWIYNPTNSRLEYYNGSSWYTYHSKAQMVSYGLWVAYDNRLWYFESTASTSFTECYKCAQFRTASTESTWAYITEALFDVNTATYTYQYDWTSDSVYRPTTTVRWYKDSIFETTQYMPEAGFAYEDTQFPVYIQGRKGSINSAVTKTSATVYPFVNDEITVNYRCTPTATDHASVLVPTTLPSNHGCEKYGVVWMVKLDSGAALTLDKAIARGYLVLTRTIDTSNYNTSTVSFRFTVSGEWTIYGVAKYWSSIGALTTDTKTITITVCDANAPVITLVSASPNPEVYPPPYTVVWRDSTPSGQVPQQTIVLDAGDNQNPESWTLTNTGTTHITMPDKTHVYNGYGSYRPTLTVTDLNGNTASGNGSFAPNKTARVYTPVGWTAPARLEYGGSVYYPSSTVAGGNAPILITAKASVAGDPLPTVTWTYGISGSTYYTGTVTGAYAELSLLASGTYDVTCTVTSGTTTIATYSWTVTVQTEVVSTESDKQIEDFALVVLNGTTPIDVCKVHTTPQYTTQWQSNDTVQFEVPRNYQYAQYLQEGDLFVFGHHGAKLMQVSYRQQNEYTITISGTSVFPQRVAITATRSEANDGYDVQTCSAEALIRYFIHSALTDPYGTQTRGADLMIHGTCQDYPTGGDAVTYSARYETLQDIVTELCESSGLGYSVGIRNMTDGSIDKTQVWIKEGTNRTYTSGGNNAVIFSEPLKNCRIASDQSSMSANVSIGAGQGIGNFREYTYYDVSGSTPAVSGFSRREVFVDAGDAADAGEIKRMSVLELKQAKQLSIRIRVLPSCQWTYGTDYDVGDTVTLVHPDRGQLDLQIFSAEHVRRQTGDELYLNLGYRAVTAPTLISKVSNANTYARK